MKNKTIISSTLIVFGLIGLAVWGSSRVPASAPGVVAGESTASDSQHPARIGNILTAEEKFYDFGRISMKNGKVSKVFTVSNLGNQDINLQNLSTSCMCTNAYIVGRDGGKIGPFGMPGHGGGLTRTSETIKAGETREIEIVYDPNAHGPAGVGMINRFVYLEDANGNKLQFEIKANVTP